SRPLCPVAGTTGSPARATKTLRAHRPAPGWLRSSVGACRIPVPPSAGFQGLRLQTLSEAGFQGLHLQTLSEGWPQATAHSRLAPIAALTSCGRRFDLWIRSHSGKRRSKEPHRTPLICASWLGLNFPLLPNQGSKKSRGVISKIFQPFFGLYTKSN